MLSVTGLFILYQDKHQHLSQYLFFMQMYFSQSGPYSMPFCTVLIHPSVCDFV